MSLDLVRALDNFSRKAFYIQAQPFVYSADKDKRLEVLKRQTEGSSAKREEWLAAQAAEAEAAKAEREKINEQLKLSKAEREKEKLEKQQAAKQDKALAKEKAALEKEEKRIQAIENLAIKREKEKEKIIEQAKKKAEQRAMADVRRKEQVGTCCTLHSPCVLSDRQNAYTGTQAREREEKIRRGIIERAEKEKARKELEVLKKQVYEEVCG